MSKRIYLVLLLCVVALFIGCHKKEPDISTEATAELEQTESTTEDEFAIGTNKDIPGYEVRETKEQKETQRQLSQEEMESKAIEELESAEASVEDLQRKKAEALGQSYEETKTYIESTAEND